MSKDNLNNLCGRDSNGWCEKCQVFCTPKQTVDSHISEEDDFYCDALEHELQNNQYYENDSEQD